INGEFTTIDVAGAVSFTEALNINDAGIVVGSYDDDTGTHGFMYVDGQMSPINVPGALSTSVNGENNSGEIVGYYLGSDFKEHGFLLNNGTFTTIDAPSKPNTYAYRINDTGVIVGSYEDQPNSGIDVGWRLGTRAQMIVVPAGTTDVFGLNGKGR